MSRFKSLMCTSCGLSGQLPGWQGLPNLRQLLLQHNSFSGGLPQSFAWLPVLDTLDLSYNQLSEVPGSDYFSYYAKSVKVLVLRGNALNGTLPGGETSLSEV
jgi:Leucine-rich repeat (LRR) protein